VVFQNYKYNVHVFANEKKFLTPIDLTKKNKKQIIILLTLLGHYHLKFLKMVFKAM